MKAWYSGTTKVTELSKLLQRAKKIGLTITSFGLGPDPDEITINGTKHISPRCLKNARVHYTKTGQMEYLTYKFWRGGWVITVHMSHYDDPYTEGWNKVPVKEFLYLRKEANK
jgi:hypothetical protein